MKYVALIRGINVGGNNIVPMATLVETFVGLGFSGVHSYIASGNLFFESRPRSPRQLERRIEAALEKSHRVTTTTVVRSRDEVAATMQALPASWKRLSAARRYNVVFLRHEVDSEAVLEGLQPKPGVDEVTYGPGALFWSTQIKALGRSALVKLISMPLYRRVTIRNFNTARKIAELING